jgi:hypothetical protein
VTRSTVQKAVVVIASKPVFGPIRDRLGVVTLALFEQKSASVPPLILPRADIAQGTSLIPIYLSSFTSRFRVCALSLQRAGFTWVRISSFVQGLILICQTGTSL